MTPVVAVLSHRFDQRVLVFIGILWLGLALLQSRWTSGADFWTLATPQLLLSVGMAFFMTPLTTIALAAVEPEETASAAGGMSFLRTMAGAIGTSVATTLYNSGAVVTQSEMVSRLGADDLSRTLQASGLSLGQVRLAVEQTVTLESNVVAITQVFLLSAVLFAGTAMIIWLAPRPAREVDAGAAH